MEIKEVSPITIFYYETESTIPGLESKAQEFIPQMMQKAEELKLNINGPMLFLYYGMDGKPETIFRVKMAVPVVEAKEDQGDFKFITTEPFRCAMGMHKGSWNEFEAPYTKLITEIMQGGHQMNQEVREIYHTIKEPDSPENLTEIQIGIST